MVSVEFIKILLPKRKNPASIRFRWGSTGQELNNLSIQPKKKLRGQDKKFSLLRLTISSTNFSEKMLDTTKRESKEFDFGS